jgi:hypothetical protein
MIGTARQQILLGVIMTTAALPIGAQVAGGSSKTAAQPQPLPITTQIKKTVVFLETDCLHDFSPDASKITPEQLQAMTQQQRAALLGQLVALTSQVENVDQSLAKLTKDEQARLRRSLDGLNISDDSVVTGEIKWRFDAVMKMTALSSDEIAAVKPDQLTNLPRDPWSGTGFFVNVADERIPLLAGEKGPRGFTYIVTNRHVIQPGIEHGKPCKVVQIFLLVNHKPDGEHSEAYAQNVPVGRILSWKFPEQDNSVDLVTIPDSIFVTEDQVKSKSIVEGDPVLFSGLFIQSFREMHTLEPIVRSGTLAMIPNGLLNTTINNMPGHIYLAEAHVFGGNSGSPIFIDPNKFAGVISGPAYKLLGVVSGEMFENTDLTMTATTTLTGNLGANSDVSMVVPAPELLKILRSPALQAQRDSEVIRLKAATGTSQQPQ